jgi:hypothetical protein
MVRPPSEVAQDVDWAAMWVVTAPPGGAREVWEVKKVGWWRSLSEVAREESTEGCFPVCP